MRKGAATFRLAEATGAAAEVAVVEVAVGVVAEVAAAVAVADRSRFVPTSST